jgi:hypothetical protein
MFDSPEIQPQGSHSKFEHRVNLAYKMSGITNREYPRDPKSVAPPGLFDTKGAKGLPISNLIDSSSSSDSEESRDNLINDIIYINNKKHLEQNPIFEDSTRRFSMGQNSLVKIGQKLRIEALIVKDGPLDSSSGSRGHDSHNMNSPRGNLVKITLPDEFDHKDFHNFDFGNLSRVDLSQEDQIDPEKSPV